MTPRLIDLGRVEEGKIVSDTIRFVNSGTEPVHIAQVKSSCGCTAVRIGDSEIGPGDTAEVAFTLNTRGLHGLIRKSLTVQFKERQLEETRFTIQATAFSEFEVSPRFVHFQNIRQNPDTLVTRFFSIRNQSRKAITITRIYAVDEILSVFPAEAVIPPGREHLVRVELKPEQKGYKTVYIHVLADYESKPEIHIPAFIFVMGE